MNDTNIQSEGECQECARLEKSGEILAKGYHRLSEENKDLREAITNYRSLVESLDKYIGILNDEINTLIPLAHAHGWRSGLVERGIVVRELIDRARKLLETPTK